MFKKTFVLLCLFSLPCFTPNVYAAKTGDRILDSITAGAATIFSLGWLGLGIIPYASGMGASMPTLKKKVEAALVTLIYLGVPACGLTLAYHYAKRAEII